jgi:dihydroorotate dehydrogenase (fumarate)
MDLSTNYLGLNLPHPLMPGASPMVDDLDTVRRLEDAGSAAIVMHSLFEEQIVAEQMNRVRQVESREEAFPEALTYFPDPGEYRLGPEDYLEQIGRIKQAVSVPVIASLNGASAGGWLDYAKLMQEAGADALELNIYYLATDAKETGEAVERNTIEIVKSVKKAITIPVAVKLSPFFSSLPNFAAKLDEAGADGIVLFNRFYQPDIKVKELEVERTLHLSDSTELLLRLRWLGILSGHVKASLALTGGVHTGIDAVKGIMSGAHAIQLVSALLIHGPDHLRKIREELGHFLEENEYDSLRQMQGNMSLLRCPDPKSYERANYAHILAGWRA